MSAYQNFVKYMNREGFMVGVNTSLKSKKQKIYIEELVGDCCEKIQYEYTQVYGYVDVVYIKECMYAQMITNVFRSIGYPITKGHLKNIMRLSASDTIKRVRMDKIVDVMERLLKSCSVISMSEAKTETTFNHYYRGYKDKITWDIYAGVEV
jgi:hypothetical protein